MKSFYLLSGLLLALSVSGWPSGFWSSAENPTYQAVTANTMLTGTLQATGLITAPAITATNLISADKVYSNLGYDADGHTGVSYTACGPTQVLSGVAVFGGIVISSGACVNISTETAQDVALDNPQTFTARQTFAGGINLTSAINISSPTTSSSSMTITGPIGVGGIEVISSAGKIPNSVFVTPVIASSATGTYPLSISGNALTATTATGVAASGVAGGSLGSTVIASSITLAAMYGAPTITGRNITAIPATSISSGSLGDSVIASSVAAGAVYDGAILDPKLSKSSGGTVSGTTTFTSSLTVSASEFSVGRNVLVVEDGKVGIGTDSPGALLSVSGDSYLDGSTYTNSLRPYSTDVLTLLGGGTNVLYINGKAGFGTLFPRSKLQVSSGTLELDGSGASILLGGRDQTIGFLPVVASSEIAHKPSIASVSYVWISTMTTPAQFGGRPGYFCWSVQTNNGSGSSRDYTIQIYRDGVAYDTPHLNTNPGNAYQVTSECKIITTTSGVHTYALGILSSSATGTQTAGDCDLGFIEF